MRDLSAHDKHELQRIQKDVETKKTELAEMSRGKEKLAAQVGQLEQTISDLQEQVGEWKYNKYIRVESFFPTFSGTLLAKVLTLTLSPLCVHYGGYYSGERS